MNYYEIDIETLIYKDAVKYVNEADSLLFMATVLNNYSFEKQELDLLWFCAKVLKHFYSLYATHNLSALAQVDRNTPIYQINTTLMCKQMEFLKMASEHNHLDACMELAEILNDSPYVAKDIYLAQVYALKAQELMESELNKLSKEVVQGFKCPKM